MVTKLFANYEAHTLLELGVSRYRIRVVSNTDKYNHTELCDFLKLLAVLVCWCLCRARYRAS